MASAVIGGLGGLLGGFLGQNQQDWLKNALIQQLNTSNWANQFGIDRALPAYNSLLDAGNNLVNMGTQFSFGAPGSTTGGAFTQLNDRLNNILGGLNQGQFQQNGLTGGSQQALGNLANLAGSLDLSPYQSILQNGGQTWQSGPLADRLFDTVNGQGPINTLQDVGGSLLGNRGQTYFTQNAQNNADNTIANGGRTGVLDTATQAAMNMLANGGMTGPLSTLFGQGNSILTSGGQTPQTAAALASALGGFQNGGSTPFLQAMQGIGLNAAGQNPLIGPGMQISFARDQAGRNARDAAENFRAQALNRGGGPGATVANGTTNEALADFSDNAQASVSQAVQQALLQSQNLGLQEQGLGASMGLGSAGTQAGQLGTYGNTLANLAGVMNQRYGLGINAASNAADTATQALLSSMGLLPTVQNSSTNLLGTAGQLGLGAGNLELGNMNLGGNLMNDYYGIKNNASGLLNNLIGEQNNFALGAGNLLNQGTGLQGNILNNVFQGSMGGDQLGLSQANSYQQALNSLLGQQGNVAGQGLNLINSGFSPLNSALNFGSQYAMNGLDLQKGLFNNYQPNSPLGGFFGSPGGSNMIGGLVKGIGGLFGLGG